MSNTKTSSLTLAAVLDNANAAQLGYAFLDLNLGTMLSGTEYDTGTITDIATVVLPYEAAVVQSARVVTSATGGSVGSYLVSDSGATVYVPTSASNQLGVATIGTDRKTITFPNTITRAVIRYLPIAAAPMEYHSAFGGLGTAVTTSTKA